MRAWERFLVIALLVIIAAIAVWDSRRTKDAWLDHQLTVTVYFANEDATALVPEVRPLKPGADPVEATLAELLRGPESENLRHTIPEGVKVLETRLEDKTLYVSFSEELRTKHWGGSTGEIMTVYSIVNSLTALPDVERVFILLDGRYEETLVGHLILNEAFTRDESLLAASTQRL